MLREITEGRMVGKRPRGRNRIDMLDELKQDRILISFENLKRRAQDRRR